MEAEDVSKFIDELKQKNVTNFTYQDYEKWANSNNRPLIPSGQFNAIILTRFGFAWNRNTGFSLA